LSSLILYQLPVLLQSFHKISVSGPLVVPPSKIGRQSCINPTSDYVQPFTDVKDSGYAAPSVYKDACFINDVRAFWDTCVRPLPRTNLSSAFKGTSSTVTFAYSQFSARSFPRPYFLTCELVLAHQLFILLFKHSSNQAADDYAFLVAISAYCSLYFCHRLNSRRCN